MEITTIIGIVIAIVIMLFGIRMLFKKPVEAVPSLDANLHIDPDSQTPIIPRHVRSQLAQQDVESDRIEPSLGIDELAPEKPSAFRKAESTPVERKAVETPVAAPSTEAEG
ncbi:hypothetical protein, partial [Klebsiella pneumoniae]|uniref:hypothetical protein n=1 Tax=Klebsiella pneumoniae TaxID=573 RepID=UPI001C4DDFD2